MKYRPLYKLFFQTKDSGKKEYESRFNSSEAIHLDLDITKNSAFVLINNETTKLIESIHKLNYKITNDIYLGALPEIMKTWIVRSSLIEEICMTNEIEGVVSTRKEINDLLEVDNPSKYVRFYGLVNKYRSILDTNTFEPILNAESLRKVYDKILIQDINNSNANNIPDGEIFRKDQVEIHSGTKVIHKGIYPEAKIIEAINIALDFLNNEEYPELIRIAVFHYLIGYIHPFYDGNGRISRYISSYYLSDCLNPLVALQLSVSCKLEQKKYYELFKTTNDIRNKGDLTYFVIGFLEIYVSGLKEFRFSIAEKQQQYDDCSKKIIEQRELLNLDDISMSILYILLSCFIFKTDEANIKLISKVIQKSEKTVRSKLKILKEYNLVESTKNGKVTVYNLNETII